jgi:hypothetical protein
VDPDQLASLSFKSIKQCILFIHSMLVIYTGNAWQCISLVWFAYVGKHVLLCYIQSAYCIRCNSTIHPFMIHVFHFGYWTACWATCSSVRCFSCCGVALQFASCKGSYPPRQVLNYSTIHLHKSWPHATLTKEKEPLIKSLQPEPHNWKFADKKGARFRVSGNLHPPLRHIQ